MSNLRRSKRVDSLKAEWDKKLREDGFKDIEITDLHGEARLNVWDSCYFSVRHAPSSFRLKREYYYQAFQFLNYYRFESQTDRHAWQMHAEGLGLRQIASSLIRMGYKTNKDYVATTINCLKQKMKEAIYEQERSCPD